MSHILSAAIVRLTNDYEAILLCIISNLAPNFAAQLRKNIRGAVKKLHCILAEKEAMISKTCAIKTLQNLLIRNYSFVSNSISISAKKPPQITAYFGLVDAEIEILLALYV